MRQASPNNHHYLESKSRGSEDRRANAVTSVRTGPGWANSSDNSGFSVSSACPAVCRIATSASRPVLQAFRGRRVRQTSVDPSDYRTKDVFTRNARTGLRYRQWSQSLLASEEKQSILQTPQLLQSVPSALIPHFPFAVRQLKQFSTTVWHSPRWAPTGHTGFPSSTTYNRKERYGWQGFGTIFDLTHQLAFLVTKFLMFSGDHDALPRGIIYIYSNRPAKTPPFSNT